MTINTTATELLQSEITVEKMLNINSIPLHENFIYYITVKKQLN